MPVSALRSEMKARVGAACLCSGARKGTWHPAPHPLHQWQIICGSPLNRMAGVQPVFSYIFLISSPRIGTSHVCSVLAALLCRVVSPVFSRRGCRSCSSSEPCTLELSWLTAECGSGSITAMHHRGLLQTPWACRKLHGARWKLSGRGLYRRRRCRE